MNSQNSGEQEVVSPEIGAELVHLLYHNTGLNYHVCAQSLVEVFEHLAQRLPSISNTAEMIVDAIKVNQIKIVKLLLYYCPIFRILLMKIQTC